MPEAIFALIFIILTRAWLCHELEITHSINFQILFCYATYY